MRESKQTKECADTPRKGLVEGHIKILHELDRYKILVESIEDYAILMLDTDGYIVSWNKGAQKTKGYTADEIIGQHFSKFYQEEDITSRKPERELALAIKMGRVEDEDWRIRKDGSKFWANVVITALYNIEGEHIGFAKVTRDLTERKQQEDAVRHANTQLRRQQHELENLNVSKDEFISLASHQLRTPATAIKQLLGLLVEGFYGDIHPGALKILQKAYESNERQLNIVNSLLKVAQIDAGKVILYKTREDLGQLLQDITDEFNDTFSYRKQALLIETPQDAPVLGDIDVEYFRMALSNLIDNASKYTPADGEIKITLSQSKKCASIAIADTGIGISDEDMKKLFTKFIRIPNELSQKVGGSGLGLYWVHRVVELHNGSIDTVSKVGKGTTFTINLPAMKE